MLSALRERKNNPIIVFLLAAIIIVFIAFFGPAMRGCGGAGGMYAARVNGRQISDADYTQRYRQTFQGYQRQWPEFNREQAEKMNLRKRVLDQMISTRLLSEKARSKGMAVDDDALRQAILDNPNFQTDGAFDSELYERILNSNGLTVGSYEGTLRDQILAEDLASVAQSSVWVSPAEIKEAFETEKRQINLEYVRVKFTGYESKVGTITEADATEWAKKPENEEAIKKHYTKYSRTRYNIPKKVRARHILARIDKDAPPDVKKLAQQKIGEARKAVIDGKMDFAEAAKRYSDDSTKDKGGDLGFFSEGQMVRPFEEAAFGMKPGEVSNIVESPFGYHVIKVEEIQEPITKTLEDVKVEIAKELMKNEKAAEASEKRAKEIFEAMKGGKSLADIAAESAAKKDLDPEPLVAEETGKFTKGGDYVPKIGVSADIAKAAWKLTMEKPYPEGPAKTEQAWVVYKLKERAEPSEAEFEGAKQQILTRLIYQKRGEAVESWTDKVVRAGAKIDIHPLALSYDEEARAAERNRHRGSL